MRAQAAQRRPAEKRQICPGRSWLRHAAPVAIVELKAPGQRAVLALRSVATVRAGVSAGMSVARLGL